MNEKSNFQAEIEKMAYNLYVQRGMVEGHDLDDWFQAEKIVMARHVSKENEGSKTKVVMTPKRKVESLRKERSGLA